MSVEAQFCLRRLGCPSCHQYSALEFPSALRWDHVSAFDSLQEGHQRAKSLPYYLVKYVPKKRFVGVPGHHLRQCLFLYLLKPPDRVGAMQESVCHFNLA